MNIAGHHVVSYWSRRSLPNGAYELMLDCQIHNCRCKLARTEACVCRWAQVSYGIVSVRSNLISTRHKLWTICTEHSAHTVLSVRQPSNTLRVYSSSRVRLMLLVWWCVGTNTDSLHDVYVFKWLGHDVFWIYRFLLLGTYFSGKQ